MATNFPTSLDVLVNPQPNDSVELVSHAEQHSNANDAIEALESKVGANNSTDPNSLDYKVKALETNILDSEEVEDLVGDLFTTGTHNNITVAYDDVTRKINLTATYNDEEVITAIATALTAGTGITKTYVTTPPNYLGDYNNGYSYALNDVISIPDGSPYGIVGSYFIRSGNPGNPGYPPEPGGATNASWTLFNFSNKITVGVDTSVIADKTYVNTAISNLIDAAPGLLDTLNEIAAAIGDDANFATTITTALATKLNIATAASTYLALSDTDERIQDVVGGMVSGNTESTGLSVTYDDPTGKLNFEITTADLPGFTEAVQDSAAGLLAHSGHTNVVATYDDTTNKVNLSVIAQLTQEQAQDYIAPLFVHNLNPNITATYDDEANKLILETIIPPSKAIMSASAPSSPSDGQFWFDTDEFRSGTTRALKVWNALSSTWEYVSSDLSLSTTNTWTSKNTYTNGIIIGLDAAPTAPVHGQIYYNKILNKLNVWDGLLWKEVAGSGDGGGGLTLIPTDASAPASTFFVGLIEPPSGATTVGDLWIDVDDDAGATEFIFAGPEAPTNYSTDTLWIDTDEPISELIYSANEPATPSYAGELWIDLDDTAGQSILSSLTPPAPAETDLWIDLANEEGYLEYKDLFKNGAAAVQAFANLPDAALYPGISIYVVLEKTVYVSIDNQWKKMYPNSDSEVLSWIGF